MNLVRWNPMNEMASFRNRFDRLFDEFFVPARRGDRSEEMTLSAWNPAADIYETDDAYVVNAEIPGVEKKDIAVDVKGRVLTLSGERSYDNEVKEEAVYRRERAYGKFQRSFTLPEAVDPEKIAAEFKDGVLKITIPKSEERKPRQITVH